MSLMKEFEHLKILLEEIKIATNSFEIKAIGKGGFGKVYKGELTHSMGRNIVAIKRLDRQFGQGDPEFLKEIVMLSRYTHENLVSLLGYCDEDGEKILVYKYASNGSLDHHLSDPCLTWTQRLKICIGAAKGLSFLHDPNGTHQRVLHCDIKSANILLDDSLNAKVADFGLAKQGPANQQHSVLFTDVRGTPGYCDPLYLTTYALTKESDVYSFGVVLFEVLCGRLCFERISRDGLRVCVPMWKQRYTENKLEEIIFEDLKTQMDPTSLETFSQIAFQCLQINREDRPTMSDIVKKLKLALKSQESHDLKYIDYADILKAAVPPLRFRSIEELNLLLSDGVFLNAGKLWFSRNDEGENYVMISIAECLVPYVDESFIYSPDSDSRFEVGCYSTYGNKFKIHVRSRFLSPTTTYEVNLVFKFRGHKGAHKLDLLSFKYTSEGDTKEAVVYVADKREDEVLVATLNCFTSNTTGTIDHQLWFEDHKYCHSLEIQGVELKPIENIIRNENLEELKERLKIQLKEIKKTTHNFGNKVIGKGRFGEVYKGELAHSKGRNIVAIKRLDRMFWEGDPEFLQEIVINSRYKHENLVSLLGYCEEDGENILVYEYPSNGRLDKHLSDPGLTWTQRLKICIGAAKGLIFLHDSHQIFFHYDIKCANILLDECMNAKLAYFGPHLANRQEGYYDPVYMRAYMLTQEPDVFSFGVVLFEVLCGRLYIILEWKQSYLEKHLQEIILQDLKQQMDPTSLETFSTIAFQCLQTFKEDRPTMSLVLKKLELALESQEFHDLNMQKNISAMLKN